MRRTHKIILFIVIALIILVLIKCNQQKNKVESYENNNVMAVTGGNTMKDVAVKGNINDAKMTMANIVIEFMKRPETTYVDYLNMLNEAKNLSIELIDKDVHAEFRKLQDRGLLTPNIVYDKMTDV